MKKEINDPRALPRVEQKDAIQKPRMKPPATSSNDVGRRARSQTVTRSE